MSFTPEQISKYGAELKDIMETVQKTSEKVKKYVEVFKNMPNDLTDSQFKDYLIKNNCQELIDDGII